MCLVAFSSVRMEPVWIGWEVNCLKMSLCAQTRKEQSGIAAREVLQYSWDEKEEGKFIIGYLFMYLFMLLNVKIET